MQILKIKVNKNCGTYTEGQTVNVKADGGGIPHDQFWRDRIRDAEYDNCVTVIQPHAKKKPAKPDED